MSFRAVSVITSDRKLSDANQNTTEITGNVEITYDRSDEVMLRVDNGTVIKQEPLDLDCTEICHNVYDSFFDVVKHEFIGNSPEVEHGSSPNVDTLYTRPDFSHDVAPEYNIVKTCIKQEHSLTTESVITDAALKSDRLLSVELIKTDNSKFEETFSSDQRSKSRMQLTINKIINTDHCEIKIEDSAPGSSSVKRIPHTVVPVYTQLSSNNGNKVKTEEAEDVQVFKINNTELKNKSPTDYNILIHGLVNCFVKIFDVLKYPMQEVPIHNKTRKIVNYYVQQWPITSEQITSEATKQHEVTVIENSIPVIVQNKLPDFNISKKLLNQDLCSSNDMDTSLLVEKKMFTCHICKNGFKRKQHLVQHMKIHAGVKPFSCNLCNYKFISNCNLLRHMTTHTGEKPFLCNLCDYKCNTNSSLKVHIMTHTGEKPFICKLCDYRCITSSALSRHMKNHTNDKPFICDFCGKKYVSNSILQRHMRVHTGEQKFCCTLCDYKCDSNCTLTIHMRNHSGEKPFSCELCGYKCISNSYLITHLRCHTGEKRFICKLCDYKCGSGSDLKKHKRTHTGEKPFSCESCDYKCATSSRLKIHMISHTGEKPFHCKFCDYKCASRCRLVLHLLTHTAESFSSELLDYICATKWRSNPRHQNKNIDNMDVSLLIEGKRFICDICNNEFKMKHHLVQHMRRHTGEKPFHCMFCNYKCASKYRLIKHLITHTGEQHSSKLIDCKNTPRHCYNRSHKNQVLCSNTDNMMSLLIERKRFSCDICKNEFKLKHHLVQHMKIHIGAKPFHCKLCDYKCVYNYNLTRHMRTHTREKPFLCNLCDYKCATNGCLVRHMKTHNGDK